MEKVNLGRFITAAKNLQAIVASCQNELTLNIKHKKSSGGELKKWENLYADLGRRISILEEVFLQNLYNERLAHGSIDWFRSLAKKIDYYDSNSLSCGDALAKAVDDMFVMSVG